MQVTEVRIKLAKDRTGSHGRLKAYVSITTDDAIRINEIKLIENSAGNFFVSMPARELTDHCPNCRCKNRLRARYCNKCGRELEWNRAERDEFGRPRLHADVTHPVNMEAREIIQDAVIEAYYDELEAEKDPGYATRYTELDGGDDEFDRPLPPVEMAAASPDPAIDPPLGRIYRRASA